MATILKPVRLVNPGKTKRRLTARQKLFFGSKRQRAAVARTLGKRHNPSFGKGKYSTNRKERKARTVAQKAYYQRKHFSRVNRRKTRSQVERLYSGLAPGRQSSRLPNVGEIITIRPLVNSGTTLKRKGTRKIKNMAKSRKRHLAGLKAARTRARRKAARSSSHRTRRRNPGTVRHRRRRHNPSIRTVVRYRRNAGHRRHYRRNPGFGGAGSQFTKALGIIGGAMVTKIASGMLPATFTSGVIGYLSIGIIAMLQGKAVGTILKNKSLGDDMALGGYVYLALKIANDYFPTLGLSLNGLGLIGGSSFYTPQVNQPGSMGTFILPAAVAGAIPPAQVASGMKGLGAGSSMRRVGRMR